MRILIYNWRDLSNPRSGGAEVYTDRVASEWVKMGHSVTLFCAAVEDLPETDLASGGYTVIRRGSKHGVYREAKRFWLKEGRGNFDLVIDEVNTRPFMTPKFVKGVPVIALVHQVCKEIWRFEYPLPIALIGRYLLEPRWLSAYKDILTITVSASSRDSLTEYGLRNVVVVPEGSDMVLDSFDKRDKELVPTFIFVGRLSKNKRPDHAVEAFRLVKNQISEAKLWVVGTGPMEDKLRKNAPKDVIFFGKVSDEEKFDLMGRAHALIVTSVREGWGLVVTEAASVGTVSIGYDVAGLRDSLNASGGIVVEASVSALGDRIVQFDLASEPVPVAWGGVVQWSKVAEEILNEIRLKDDFYFKLGNLESILDVN